MGSSKLICFEIYFSIKFAHSALYVYSNDENMIIYNKKSETNIKKIAPIFRSYKFIVMNQFGTLHKTQASKIPLETS